MEETLTAQTGERPGGEEGAADGGAQERMRREVREFVTEFPDVKPEEIDDAVWQEVRQGKPLTAAYRERREQKLLEENRQLRERLESEARNDRNRRTSLGTQRTGGRDGGRDAFLDTLLSDG